MPEPQNQPETPNPETQEPETVIMSVRLDRDTKEKLEGWAKQVGISLSELVRNYILKILKIQADLEIKETLKSLEERLVKALILSEDFQQLLKKLPISEKSYEYGFNGGRYEFIKSFDYAPYYVPIQRGDKIMLGKIKEIEAENQYGRTWTDGYTIEEVKTLWELDDFLQRVEDSISGELQVYVKSVRELLRGE